MEFIFIYIYIYIYIYSSIYNCDIAAYDITITIVIIYDRYKKGYRYVNKIDLIKNI